MKHIAVAAHGIRTHGGWQKRLENLLQQVGPEIEVYHFRYGCFSFLAFLVPFLRWLIIRRFRRELRDLFARTSPTRIDIVAHSLGTHIVAWGLRGMSGGAGARMAGNEPPIKIQPEYPSPRQAPGGSRGAQPGPAGKIDWS